ncbi:hypothetical protein IFM89_020603 [Coptis chinensis]|uniref:Uncharacterized protein n=1 Tax=Coptis chinensis TaxID=261450 RepID=A0A835M491_9MAGN|nr:hypothetical protein IFM89_020603 [Coptis chinensis]
MLGTNAEDAKEQELAKTSPDVQVDGDFSKDDQKDVEIKEESSMPSAAQTMNGLSFILLIEHWASKEQEHRLRSPRGRLKHFDQNCSQHKIINHGRGD